MLNFVAFKVNGFIDQPGVNLSQSQVINRLYSRAGGGYFPQIPIWQVCFWSSKVFGLSVLNMTGHLIIFLRVNFPYPGSQHFSNPYSSNSWVSRKIPLTMSMTRDTCWGNDTRYGCGLTMASFSQRERCYERPQ